MHSWHPKHEMARQCFWFKILNITIAIKAKFQGVLSFQVLFHCVPQICHCPKLMLVEVEFW